MNSTDKQTCYICNKKYSGYGNSIIGAMALVDGKPTDLYDKNTYQSMNTRCCDDCNIKYVIRGRLTKMSFSKDRYADHLIPLPLTSKLTFK